MANLRVAVPISCVGKLKRYKSAMRRTKPPRAVSQHLIYDGLSNQRGEKLMKNDPLIVPAQLLGRFIEYAVIRDSGAPRFIDERVVCLEHGEMQLRHEHVGIVARVADNGDALRIPLQVTAVQTKQELRRVVPLVEERMTCRSVAVQALKVELRAARIVQFRRIGMQAQGGPVSRNIVSHKLAENWPASCCVS